MKDLNAWVDQLIADAQPVPEPHEHDWEPYFGQCPECPPGTEHEYLNIERNHIFFCDTHRTRWSIGWNLFSCWREETEELWEQNAEHIQDYRDVEAITTCTVCGVKAGEQTDGSGSDPTPRAQPIDDDDEVPF